MPSTWPQLVSVACIWPSVIVKALQGVPWCGQGGEPLLQGSLWSADRSTSTPGNHRPPCLPFPPLPVCSTVRAKLASVDGKQAMHSACGPASVRLCAEKVFSTPHLPRWEYCTVSGGFLRYHLPCGAFPEFPPEIPSVPSRSLQPSYLSSGL